MTNRPPRQTVTGIPRPPLSPTNPPPPSWWCSNSQQQEELSREEKSAIYWKSIPCAGFTLIAILGIILFFLLFPCHVSFSVESISGPPSSSGTWHVDFLVKKPCSWCRVYYDGSDLYAKLGHLNAAVLRTSLTRGSLGRHTSFSVDLVTEGNQTDVVAAFPRVFELDMKLSAKMKLTRDAYNYKYGYFDIRCYNLTLGDLNVKCDSSFKSSPI